LEGFGASRKNLENHYALVCAAGTSFAALFAFFGKCGGWGVHKKSMDPKT
jgi:hypothetical protein